MIGLSKYPSSRVEAARLNISRFYTGVACKRGHRALRHTTNGACSACVNLARKTKYRKHISNYYKGYKARLHGPAALAYARKMAKHWADKVRVLSGREVRS